MKAKWSAMVLGAVCGLMGNFAFATPMTQEAENQSVPASGVGPHAYTNASGGYVMQAWGDSGWSVGLMPNLTGRYTIDIRTRAGWAPNQSYFGDYYLSIGGQNLALTRDDSRKAWYNDNENYVWWTMTDTNGVVLSADSTGQVTGDWTWGFVDAFEFSAVAAMAPINQEAENQPVASSGVGQRAYAHASGGSVMEAYGASGWNASFKPGLTGQYMINVRTRAGWAPNQSCFGDYYLNVDGQDIVMTRDESTKMWYDDNENYVWWKMTNANGIALTADSIGQVTGDWVWGNVDAYEFVMVPEPTSMLCLMLGAVALVRRSRRA